MNRPQSGIFKIDFNFSAHRSFVTTQPAQCGMEQRRTTMKKVNLFVAVMFVFALSACSTPVVIETPCTFVGKTADFAPWGAKDVDIVIPEKAVVNFWTDEKTSKWGFVPEGTLYVFKKKAILGGGVFDWEGACTSSFLRENAAKSGGVPIGEVIELK
jgi:hypothetical protein